MKKQELEILIENKVRKALKEYAGISNDDIAMILFDKLEELSNTIKNVKNVEDWAKTYYRSAKGLIEQIVKVTHALNNIK